MLVAVTSKGLKLRKGRSFALLCLGRKVAAVRRRYLRESTLVDQRPSPVERPEAAP